MNSFSSDLQCKDPNVAVNQRSEEASPLRSKGVRSMTLTKRPAFVTSRKGQQKSKPRFSGKSTKAKQPENRTSGNRRKHIVQNPRDEKSRQERDRSTQHTWAEATRGAERIMVMARGKSTESKMRKQDLVGKRSDTPTNQTKRRPSAQRHQIRKETGVKT
jgi:hypothetical protein